MRVTRPVSLSPTSRHGWKPCTWWRLDARLTPGRNLRLAALTACGKHLPFVNTIKIHRNHKKASAFGNFFDFLKALQFNGLRCFHPVCAKKSCGRAKKKCERAPKKRTAKARRTARIRAPSTSSSKTRKKSSDFF